MFDSRLSGSSISNSGGFCSILFIYIFIYFLEHSMLNISALSQV